MSSPAHIFIQVWTHIGDTTLTLAEETVTPKDANVLKHPSKEFGSDAETSLAWEASHGSRTLGTVVYESPAKGTPGKAMLFGVRFGSDILGPPPHIGEFEVYFEYTVHHVGTPDVWIRPENFVYKDFSFNVDAGDIEFHVTISPTQVGEPEETSIFVEVKDVFKEGFPSEK